VQPTLLTPVPARKSTPGAKRTPGVLDDDVTNPRTDPLPDDPILRSVAGKKKAREGGKGRSSDSS